MTTSNPAEVVVHLYDGALRFMREARAAMAAGRRAECGEKINRAHAIIELLASTLDAQHDPVLAGRLLSLYDYAMRRLIESNLTQNESIIVEVEDLLAPLRDAWRVVSTGQSAVKRTGT